MTVLVLTVLTVLIGRGTVAVSKDCGSLPNIKHSGNNMSGIYIYHDDTAAKFYCFPGYRPEGNEIYKCLDGSWVGGPFSCIINKCPPLGSPDHGVRLDENYEAGHVVRFKCDLGYQLIGSNTSQCQADSKWNPPNIPKCLIKKCPAPPSFEHGTTVIEKAVNGQDNVYGAIVRVHCVDGYILSGPVRIRCNANRHWTKVPKCKLTTCPKYDGLDLKCVKKSVLVVNNTLLVIYCTEHSTLVTKGDNTASCYDNKWDDISIRCLCHCKVSINNDLILLENVDFNGLLKHNDTLIWSCKNGSTKLSAEPLICDNGRLNKMPTCVLPALSDIKQLHKTQIVETVVVPIIVVVVFATVVTLMFVVLHKRRQISLCKAGTPTNNEGATRKQKLAGKSFIALPGIEHHEDSDEPSYIALPGIEHHEEWDDL